MKRICGIPGCSKLVEAVSNAYYCDIHTEAHFAKHDNLEAEHADEVEGTLDGMLSAARADLQNLSTIDGEDHDWHRYVAEQLALHVPFVQAAIYSGEIWTAVRHALWSGLMAAHGQNAPDKHKLKKMEPDAALGTAYRKSQADKPRSRHEWTREQVHEPIRAELRRRLEEGEKRPEIVKDIARHQKLKLRQIQNITKGIG